MMVVLSDCLFWHVTVTERRMWRKTIQEALHSELLTHHLFLILTFCDAAKMRL